MLSTAKTTPGDCGSNLNYSTRDPNGPNTPYKSRRTRNADFPAQTTTKLPRMKTWTQMASHRVHHCPNS